MGQFNHNLIGTGAGDNTKTTRDQGTWASRYVGAVTTNGNENTQTHQATDRSNSMR